jgi:hypothetical protein
MTVKRQVAYVFSFDAKPLILDDVIEELQAARNMTSGKATLEVTGYENQHDGFDLTFSITGAVPR